MKKLLPILLMLAMMIAMFAGCGSDSASVPASEAAPASSVEEAPEAPVVEPAESAIEEASEAEPEAPAYTVEYPLTDDTVTFDCFASVPSNVQSFVDDTLSDFPVYQIAEEATGIHMDWLLVAPEAEATQINLILATGDFPTYIKAMDSLYPAGKDSAVEEEIAVDISGMMEEFAPDYYAFCQENDMFKLLASDTGTIISVTPLATSRTEGPLIRKDWLDDLGLEVPTTIDELNEVLIAFRNEKGATNAVLVDSQFNGHNVGFDFSMRGFLTGLEFNYIDGEAVVYFENENFIPYLDTIKFWVESGFCPDYTSISSPGQKDSMVLTDASGYWINGSMALGDAFLSSYTNGTIDVDAIPTVTYEKGAELHVSGKEVSLNAENGWTITTSCEDPEMALGYLNWFYTEEGNIAASFGREGEGLVWDENGEPGFGDIIMNNPEGYAMNLATMLYVGYGTPVTAHPNVEKIQNSVNNDEQNGAADIWFSNRSTEYMMKGDMTSEESEIYSNLSGDIGTRLEEFMAKYVVGEATLDDYESVCAWAHENGLDELIAVKKAAHERFLAR